MCFGLNADPIRASSNRNRSPSEQRPQKATKEDMTKYHSDDYIKFLYSIRPDNMNDFNKQMQRCE